MRARWWRRYVFFSLEFVFCCDDGNVVFRKFFLFRYRVIKVLVLWGRWVGFVVLDDKV